VATTQTQTPLIMKDAHGSNNLFEMIPERSLRKDSLGQTSIQVGIRVRDSVRDRVQLRVPVGVRVRVRIRVKV
jgi:hypothetical protein